MEIALAKKRGTIVFKLLAVVVPIMTVCVLMLVFIAYNRSKDILTDSAVNLIEASNENQVSNIESWLDGNLKTFKSVKNVIESTDLDDPSLQKILDSYYGFDGNYSEGLYIGTEDGKIFKASQSTVDHGSNIAQSGWFKEGLTRINMNYGVPHQDASGNYVISATGMLMTDSSVPTVIGADVSLKRLSIIVNSLVEMQGAEAFLINEENSQILAHRNGSYISKTLDSLSSDPFYKGLAESVEMNELGTQLIEGHITSIKSVAGTNWLLVSHVPTGIVYAEVANLRNFLTIISIIAVLVLGVSIGLIIKIVLKSVRDLTNTIGTMSSGDFSVEVDVKGNDEISFMSESLQTFIKAMRTLITDIKSVSSTLNNQAEDSNDISGDLFNSSKMQSESMKDLSSTVDELAKSVNEIALSANTLTKIVTDTSENGKAVTEKMEETVDQSEKGHADMEKVREAMNTIQVSMQALEESVNKVGKVSEEVTSIVNLIGSIAEETNLLSLNASIEAARAGDAGRGFAVVAKEIGTLASTSTNAVKDIGDLISQIREQVDDAIQKTRDGADYINDSSRLINTSLDTFDTIFASIQATNTSVHGMIDRIRELDTVASSVAAISEEQAASAEEILASSQLMVEESKHISDNSELVALGSEKVKASALRLTDEVARFRL